MEIILLERIAKLGALGDTVKVKDGFARNFLLPQGKALRANKANMAVFEARREELEKRNAEMKVNADEAAAKIDGSSYVVIRSAQETGQLYGSVSTRDIAALAAADGASVTRNNIVLPNPIKSIGLHEVEISLHADVSVTVTLNVARSEDEAERQARGENVVATEEDATKEEAIAPEEIFEDETKAAEIAAELSKDEETGDAEARTETEDPSAEDAAEEESAAPEEILEDEAKAAEIDAELTEAEETGDAEARAETEDPPAEDAAEEEAGPAEEAFEDEAKEASEIATELTEGEETKV